MNAESFEPGTPQTVLFAEVKRFLEQRPFKPFRIVTSSGRAYDVPTVDHAVLFPMLRKIYLADDSGRDIAIHALHVSSIESLRHIRRKRAA